MNDDGSFQVGTWAPGEHFEDFLLMKDAAGDWHEAPMPAVGGYGTIPDWARAIKFAALCIKRTKPAIGPRGSGRCRGRAVRAWGRYSSAPRVVQESGRGVAR